MWRWRPSKKRKRKEGLLQIHSESPFVMLALLLRRYTKEEGDSPEGNLSVPTRRRYEANKKGRRDPATQTRKQTGWPTTKKSTQCGEAGPKGECPTGCECRVYSPHQDAAGGSRPDTSRQPGSAQDSFAASALSPSSSHSGNFRDSLYLLTCLTLARQI